MKLVYLTLDPIGYYICICVPHEEPGVDVVSGCDLNENLRI